MIGTFNIQSTPFTIGPANPIGECVKPLAQKLIYHDSRIYTLQPMKVIPPQTIAARCLHGINAVSVILLILSGLQIYNANPVFGGRAGWHFPPILLLGGWLAGGRDWHFAAMNLFAINLLLYGLYIAITRRWNKRFLQVSDLKAIAQSSNPKRTAYSWHRGVYTLLIPMLLLSILSGLGMYKPVQFDWVLQLVGQDWQTLRLVHFCGVPVLTSLILLHVHWVWRIGQRKLLASMFW